MERDSLDREETAGGPAPAPEPEGLDDQNTTVFPAQRGQGVVPEGTRRWTGEILGGESPALTADGGLAVDGGHLPGKRDTFEGELTTGPHREPGSGERANTGTHRKA